MSSAKLNGSAEINQSSEMDVGRNTHELAHANDGAEIVDRAGNAILGLVSRAADVAAADLQEARVAAEKLSDQLRTAHVQLRAAHKQINDLKANVRH
jgi:hypothetical protein